MSEREVERNFCEQNTAHIVGTISQEFEKNHELPGRSFLRTYVNVPRKSGKDDVIPVVVDVEQVIDNKMDQSFIGKYASVFGRLCSYARFNDDGTKRIDKYLYATEFDIYDNKKDIPYEIGKNDVSLTGKVLYDPESRTTPLGRVITEFSVLSPRKKGKPDRVPCIAWGGDAIEMADVGSESMVCLKGRFQSRNYLKMVDEENAVEKTAYEVSVRSLYVIDAAPKSDNCYSADYEDPENEANEEQIYSV